MNWGIESEGKGTRTIQHPVKLRREGTLGVETILYSHAQIEGGIATGP